MTIRVPELDAQCWNWDSAKMGSNIYTTNHMNAETTSPVESQSSTIKEKLSISGKMDNLNILKNC